MLHRRLSLLVGVLLCVVGGYLALGGAAAFALNTYVLSGSFGGSGAGALSEPSGIAVNNETGNLYVVDKGHNRVEEFDSIGGTLLGEFDGVAAGHPLSGPEGIAVDNSTNPLDPSAGDVYVVDAGHHVLDKFTAAGSYVGQLTETTSGASFGELYGVAVDPNGVVWVYQASGEIDSFSDAVSNVFVAQRSSPFGTSPGFTVDGEDNLYVDRGLLAFAKLNSAGEVLIEEVDPGPSTAAAVNTASGGVFIDNAQSIGAYDASGGFLSRFAEGNLSHSVGVAVNPVSGVVYATDAAANLVDTFEEGVLPDVTTGGALGVQGTSATLNGTVNPDGIPVTSCVFEYGTDTSYGQSVLCASNPGSGTSPVAVSAEPSGLQEGTTYHYRLRAANAGGAHSGEDQTFITLARPSIDAQSSGTITQTTANLQAEINPHGLATTYHFEYGTSTAYGTSVPAPDGDLAASTGDQEAAIELTGLQAGTVYHYRTVAVNSLGTATATDGTFTTEPPLQIDSVSARDITASSATLDARINPRGVDTTYRFEYGASTAYGTSIPVPDGDVGSATGDVSVSQQLTGLLAGATYHYRVTAHNALGSRTSTDHTFIYSTPSGGLPDGRGYEMVTPPHKNAVLLGQRALIFAYPDLAEDGSRMIARTIGCFAGVGSCAAFGSDGEPYAFTRTSGGWVTSALAPSATQVGTNPLDKVSADAGIASFAIETPPMEEYDWYARSVSGAFSDIGPVTPPSQGRTLDLTISAMFVSVATADLSHLVWQANSSVHWPFDSSEPLRQYGSTVYEYVGSGNAAPVLVGVSGGRGSTDLISGCETELAGGEEALSADGRTVFFIAVACPSGSGVNAGVPVPADELYARIDESRSVLVSGRSPADCTSAGCLASPAALAQFTGASADGLRVFFASTQRLTDSASEDNTGGDSGNDCHQTVGVNGCNLYMYDFAAPAGHNLVAVSAGDSSGGGPRVQGVTAVSRDGSHVYFVARGVLTGAGNGMGQVAVDGGANLYVYERDARFPAGHLAFVATLSDALYGGASDSQQWTRNGGSMNVTPDGRFLVFTSSNALTPDDTSTSGVPQVFRYDALTGVLVRISIGDRGFNDNGNGGTPCAGNACTLLAASIVPPSSRERAGAPREDPTMSNDGSYVFFESPAALVPGAFDDVQIATLSGEALYATNVYEYHEGRVYLISDGKDVQNFNGHSTTRLLGSDATGSNVFFMTADPLVAQDTDTQQDVYDARVCTSSEPCIAAPEPSVPCQGEACHGTAGVAPVAPGAGSVAFSGPGNLAAPSAAKGPAKKKAAVRCARGRRLAHGRCVKAHPKKKGKKASAKRATANHGGKK